MINPLWNLQGRVALVTGASRGLGAYFAEVLAKAGAKVAMGARDVERLSNLAERIEAEGGRALPVGLDVADPESVKRAIELAQTELGPLRILINNAGIVADGSAHQSPWCMVDGTSFCTGNAGPWRGRKYSKYCIDFGFAGLSASCLLLCEQRRSH